MSTTLSKNSSNCALSGPSPELATLTGSQQPCPRTARTVHCLDEPLNLHNNGRQRKPTGISTNLSRNWIRGTSNFSSIDCWTLSHRRKMLELVAAGSQERPHPRSKNYTRRRPPRPALPCTDPPPLNTHLRSHASQTPSQHRAAALPHGNMAAPDPMVFHGPWEETM